MSDAVDLENACPIKLKHELKGHTKAVYSLAWSPNGTRLATGSKDGTVRLWDTKTWETVITLKAHTLGVWSVCWSPDGKKLATGGMDSCIRVWDPVTGQQLATLQVPTFWVFSVSWSPDGRFLASGDYNTNVLVFDAVTSTLVKTLKGHTMAVITTAWSPNGSLLASGSIDCSIRIWDIESGSTVHILRANTPARNDINGLSWSPDGLVLAAASQDSFIRLWNPAEEVEILSLAGHTGWTRGVAYSCNGQILATAGEDKSVRIWNPKTSQQLSCLKNHSSPVWSVGWSPDDSLLASGSGLYESQGGDTRVLIWEFWKPVSIDIKPSSWPNPLNLASRGVLPVTICGTEDLDVMTIDSSTVKLTRVGLDDGVCPISWSYEDVATPWTGELGGGHALEGDGYLDLTLKFKTQEVRTALGLGAFETQVIPLMIIGNLKEAAGGIPIKGQDFVWILKLHGDSNDDMFVNLGDLAVLSAHWCPGPPLGILGYDAASDLNGDGVVNMVDVAQVSANWGQFWQP